MSTANVKVSKSAWMNIQEDLFNRLDKNRDVFVTRSFQQTNISNIFHAKPRFLTSKNAKKKKDEPLIIRVFFCDSPLRQIFHGRGMFCRLGNKSIYSLYQ